MFPEELFEQGLSKEVLSSILTEVQIGKPSHIWELNDVPTISFYRTLHTYLWKHPK